MPTQNRWKTAWLSRFSRSQAYTKPTRCLHQPTLATGTKISLLTVLKFSREFSANQRANDCYST